ncbi:MAG TPA: hypothetical protein PL105_20700, partial [Caldilineaceae bacterium]|nr:hypothetical protein [Caldilineaceae bacterium]
RAGLLPTIVSRCQVLELRPLAAGVIADALESRGTKPDEAQLLARLSNGRMGWALNQLLDKESRTQREEALHTLWQLCRASRVERLA